MGPTIRSFGYRRDPWWDVDRRVSRRRRRRRLVVWTVVVTLAVSMGIVAGEARAASTTVDLDQWAPLEHAWQNGNLNANNARYPEGGVVPFRLAIEGLTPGTHEIHLNYDFTAGGHKAYDFLATWNATNAGGAICLPSGGAISSMCPGLPSPSTYTFPSDGFKTDGLKVSGAEAASGMTRRLTLWGGTVTWIGGLDHSGSASGNSSVDMLVRFHTSGTRVLLAWGGHLAQSSYWNTADGGAADGASLVSGAPWHMRTLQLDGTGNKNQDRSISPSAIVGTLPPVAAPTPTPKPTPRPAPTTPRDVIPPGVKPSPPNTAADPASTPGELPFALLLAMMAATAAIASQLRPRADRRR
jgi:hypothetical protein